MPSPISRRPAGLLDLLLSQQQGENPDNLGNSVSPTIDLTDFYETDRVSVATATANFTGLTAVTVTVPAAENWKLYGVSASWTWATANQDLKVKFELRNIPVSEHILASPSLQTSTGATDTGSVAFMLPHPRIIPPGTLVRCRGETINLDAQANIAVKLNVLHVRMEV